VETVEPRASRECHPTPMRHKGYVIFSLPLVLALGGGRRMADRDYSRSGQRRELWYTRTISIVEARTR
jgi:hypothetical protein